MWTRTLELSGRLAPSRAYLIGFGVVNLAALVVAFIPLFNLVGYESAALFGGVLGLLATGLTVHAVRRGDVDAPLAPRRSAAPLHDFGKLAIYHLALAVGPLLILVLNGLRVPNCDWGAGFAFWGLIVVPAILLGQSAAWLSTALFGDRPVLSWLGAFFLPLADGVALLRHLMMEPPIVGHQWFIGYFGGSIYDEALAVPPSLIAYRVLHLVAIVAVVASLSATYELRRGRWAGWTVALGLGATVVFFAGFSQRTQLGISVDRGYIAAELGGKVETDHFLIYYPEERATLRRLDELIEDHEFRYHQLREFFGTDPVAESGRKVRSFVYADRESKGRLMGGRDTMVAKLWLHEMHILWGGPGDHLLAHELAHIFTEPFGSGPLRLSMQNGVGVNMGLVEGAAAAAEWRSNELTPHQASAAMRQLGIAPDLRRILGARGFWTEASGRAYTPMGSFVRFLIDEEGVEAFRQAYGRGDFKGAYGVEVAELIRRWEEFVDAIELTDQQMAVAKFQYDRPSIFGRECARALAEQRRLARNAAARGAYGVARGHYEACLVDAPDDPTIVREYSVILAELGEKELALELLEEYRQGGQLARVQKAQFLELIGDLYWRRDESEEAARYYRRGLELGVPVDRERSLKLKARLAEAADERGRAVLVERMGDGERMYYLTRWRADEEEDPIAAYLVGRRLWQDQNYGEAIPHLEAAKGAMRSDALDGELASMLGQSYYFQGRLDESRQIWEALAQSPLSRYGEGANKWLQRLRWAEGNSQ